MKFTDTDWSKLQKREIASVWEKFKKTTYLGAVESGCIIRNAIFNKRNKGVLVLNCTGDSMTITFDFDTKTISRKCNLGCCAYQMEAMKVK